MSNEHNEVLRRSGRLAFVVCGPSGAGKNSVIDEVMRMVDGLSFSVSYTTRPRRPGETDGVDYSYVSQEEFDRLVAEGELLEHVGYLGHSYGTGRSQIEKVLARGEDVILNIDVEGARKLRAEGLGEFAAVYVFVALSSLELLRKRLRGRGTEGDEQIEARLDVAKREMKALPDFDYLVLNDEFETCVEELSSVITAERCRVRS